MNPSSHNAVFDILVACCGAAEHNRHYLKERLPDLEQRGSYLFCGKLGMSGRFVVDAEGCWSVVYNEADRNTKRDAMVAKANAALRELQGS